MTQSTPATRGAVIEREVGATEEEFVRGLHTAFPGAVLGGPLCYRATWQGVVMNVEMTPHAPRIIGRLCLPVLRVVISFPAADPLDASAMLAHFDLATHRGGG